MFLDPKLLRSILSNLISNAMKYSCNQTEIILRVIHEDRFIIFEVEDHGIGIPSHEIPKVYETFYRGSNANFLPGTGLGIAVVKTCVDIQKGQIKIFSDTDKGTRVKVYLPLFTTPVNNPFIGDQKKHI